MAQLLETLVVLSGRTDSSFTNLGNNILALGNRVNGVSEQIIRFGKEATKEFVEYDDVMREIRALGGYDQSTMDTLHEINRTIAQTSRYTMDQAAEAEVLMAQLGLGMKDIQTLLPSVMNMATAGNMQMGDSLDYLYYTLRALDMPLSDAGLLADQMAKTAAISAADIDTLGLSLQRLGSGSQFFAGGSSELLAILGAISQFGEDMQGASAGTQLRNFMLTLLAPTMSKEKLMQEMGMTEEAWGEFEQYMDDAGINVTDTAQAMDTLGLSMYDARTGELKPMIQILGELDASLAGMEESEKNALLGQLFGKRTTITALNLISSLGTIIDMQKQIEDSEGFTLGMSEIMDGGPGGAIRELTASWDMLKTTVGEVLGPGVQKGAEFLTGMVNGIANMDPAAMKGIAASMTALAAAGPGMMLVGTAFKLLGFLTTPAGIAALTALTGIGLVKFFKEMDEKWFKSQFGDMSLNVDELTGSLEELFRESQKGREEYESHIAVLEEAQQKYKDTSVTLSQTLLTAAISGRTLTEEDKQSIMGLAESFHEEFNTAMLASFDASASFLSMLFGGDENALNSEGYQSNMLMMGSVYGLVAAEVEKAGNDLGELFGRAMDDGIITGDEYAAIMGKIAQYNEAMGVFTRAENMRQFAEDMYGYQHISWDSAEEALKGIFSTGDKTKEEMERTFAGEMASNTVLWEQAIASGEYTWEDMWKAQDAMRIAHEGQLADIDTETTKYALGALDALFGQGETEKGWFLLKKLYENGDLKRDDNENIALDAAMWADYLPAGANIEEYATSLDAVYGTWRKMKPILEPYLDVPEIHDAMQWIYDAEDIAGHLRWLDPANMYTIDESGKDILRAYGWDLQNLQYDYETGQRSDPIQGRYIGTEEELNPSYDKPYNPKEMDWFWVENFARLYDTDAILSDRGINLDANHPMRNYAAASLVMAELYDVDNYGHVMFDEPVDPEVYRRTTLPATVDSEGLANVAGSAGSEAKNALMDGWGSPVLVADVEIRKPGQVNNPNLLTMSAYAEGGRATEASIFGEAGPEWAIPEEHTDRVAALLNSARQAAGFTWGELIGRNGGLNAGGHEPVSIVYAPVIYANDATGVEEKLKEDKLRLENWLEERRMRDEVEVFA